LSDHCFAFSHYPEKPLSTCPMDEMRLLAMSLEKIVAGRTICLVGNAASLLKTSHGPEIDNGCVVRLNSGVPIRTAAQGRRVDLHCFTTYSSFQENMRRSSWRVRLKSRYFAPTPSVWLSGEERETCINPEQLFYPLSMLDHLSRKFGTKPSAGARAIHMLTELTAAPIRLYGFDFKDSPSFYRRKENKGPHDWDAERDYALILARSGRLSIID
jgi:hypothetical protein